MLGLDLGLGSAVPAVRRPVLEAAFGGGGGAAGLPGMVLPAASQDPWQRNLVSVTLQLGLAPCVDMAELLLSADDQAPSVAIGDTGTVSLGYEDSSTDLVFTGQVESLRRSAHGTLRLAAGNGGAPLSRLRLNQSYEQQAAGDVVGELAGRAGVGTDTVEDGVDLPFYVLDDRRSAYEHIAALARKSGYLAYFTPEGKLNFKPFAAGRPVQTFAYGQDILALEVTEAAPVVGTVATAGEGAAGSRGQQAWSWLVKDPSPVQGSAGDGGPQRLIQDGSLRSADAAQGAAAGIAGAAGLTNLTGRLLVPGAAAVTVGSTVEVTDAPQDALNGLWLARRVCHRFSKREGFTTMIELSRAGEGGAGGLGGLLGAIGGLL